MMMMIDGMDRVTKLPRIQETAAVTNSFALWTGMSSQRVPPLPTVHTPGNVQAVN